MFQIGTGGLRVGCLGKEEGHWGNEAENWRVSIIKRAVIIVIYTYIELCCITETNTCQLYLNFEKWKKVYIDI